MVRHRLANGVRARFETWDPWQPVSRWCFGHDCHFIISWFLRVDTSSTSPCAPSELRRVLKPFLDQLFTQSPQLFRILRIRRVCRWLIVLAVREESARRLCKTCPSVLGKAHRDSIDSPSSAGSNAATTIVDAPSSGLFQSVAVPSIAAYPSLSKSLLRFVQIPVPPCQPADQTRNGGMD